MYEININKISKIKKKILLKKIIIKNINENITNGQKLRSTNNNSISLKYLRQQNKKKLKLQNLSRSLYYLYFCGILGHSNGILGYYSGILGYSGVFLSIPGYSWVNVWTRTITQEMRIYFMNSLRIDSY